mmetsp:Transcript_20227/g.24920  ORF Transcript_20227/g.24920 Transcript_20227/m.24920 type:complete len:857 (+) Transcript_20227:25-2595(+)
MWHGWAQNTQLTMAQSDDDEDRGDDHEEMKESEEGSDDDESEDEDEDEEENHYFIDTLRTIADATPLSQLLLCRRGDGGDKHDTVSSLQVQSLVSVINADLSGKTLENEMRHVVVETCSHIITALQGIYQQMLQDKTLYADPMGMDALNRALSTRIKRLPADRIHNIDGCSNILTPPSTSDQVQPSTIVKEVEDILKATVAMKSIFQHQLFDGDEVTFQMKSVDELRTANSKGNGGFLDAAMMLMWSHSFEDCIDGFSHPNKKDCGMDELIDDFINYRDVDCQHMSRGTAQVCLFAGIVRALNDLKDYRGKQNSKKSTGVNNVSEEKEKEKERGSEGHLLYEDDEPEMYHGWSGSWAVDDDRPSKNDTYYGVKLGTILDFAKQQAKKMVKKAPSGPKYALPWAKFHQDMSADDEGGRLKASNQATTPNDFATCRAKHDYIDDDTFSGDTSSFYSSNVWVHDGSIGFSHTGSGWKNREFFGHLYGYDLSGQDENVRSFTSRELSNEFWSTPNNVLADGTNNLVWVQGDRRIKGFSTDSWSSSYIFSLAKNPRNDARLTAGLSKRPKVSKSEDEGRKNIIVFDSERIGYLKHGVIQEWNLSEANRHDRVRRMVSMSNIENDLSQWNEHEVVDCSGETWMDERGAAEATAGVKPDSIRVVDIYTPSSIGYLPNGMMAFAHLNSSQIPIYGQDLREVSRLVGFGSGDIEIVQRPTFERIGDKDTFVASDRNCVKIFDLRSGKAEMTIQQKCVSSEPIIVSGAKFVCNRLRAGKGAMMWDLRSQRPLYSLPISANTEIAWVPTLDGTSKPPILMTSEGECYKYGIDYPQDDEWEHKAAVNAWSNLEKNDNSSDNDGDCSIM